MRRPPPQFCSPSAPPDCADISCNRSSIAGFSLTIALLLRRNHSAPNLVVVAESFANLLSYGSPLYGVVCGCSGVGCARCFLLAELVLDRVEGAGGACEGEQALVCRRYGHSSEQAGREGYGRQCHR